jgi:pectinesterase
MKNILPLTTLFLLAALPASAARLVVTVTNDSGLARPAETIAVPFAQILHLLDPDHDNAQYWMRAGSNIPAVRFDNLLVKDSAGNAVPAQVTNLDTKGGRNYAYNDLLFQHDFAAGEKSATFTIETVATQVPPYPSKVYCRYVPDRLDDFAWENDLIAHRIYGPLLEDKNVAGPDLMPDGGSGIDVWSKRFSYSIIDRWYGKDHDALHTDTGEGLDMYETGQARGDGGTGVWDDQNKVLYVSHDFSSWKVMANGPIRAEFELGYDAWDAGNGVKVSEVKRFTLDAGQYLNEIDSTFTITGADSVTIGIGLTEHTSRSDNAQVMPSSDSTNLWESVWENYRTNGQFGTGLVLAPEVNFVGFAKSQKNSPASKNLRPDDLALVKVKNGETIRYYAGAAWEHLGSITTNDQWTAYLTAVAQRLRAPVKVSVALEGAP